MDFWLQAVTLRGQHASLCPLAMDHHDQLVEAAADGKLWELWYTSVPRSEGMRAEMERRLVLQASGKMLPFAVLRPNEKVVGMTTFMNLDARNQRLEIGSTWYAQSVQRTAVNTQCKLLLLEHAFESLDCVAVEFRTSFFNHPSRRAIERLGAKLDGILRNHTRHRDGTMRDTCVYSIIASEWPTVRTHLRARLEVV